MKVGFRCRSSLPLFGMYRKRGSSVRFTVLWRRRRDHEKSSQIRMFTRSSLSGGCPLRSASSFAWGRTLFVQTHRMPGVVKLWEPLLACVAAILISGCASMQSAAVAERLLALEQDNPEDWSDVITDPEVPPYLGGCSPENPGPCIQRLFRNIHYPTGARRAGIEGKVQIEYVVDEKGDVIAAWVARSVDPELDREALRVVRLSKYSPALVDGTPVKVRTTMTITFRTSGSPY